VRLVRQRPGSAAALLREPAMLIRPFRHRQVRIGPQPLAPDPQQILGAVEAEVEVCRQVVVGQIIVTRGKP